MVRMNQCSEMKNRNAEAVLAVEDLELHFGGVTAINGSGFKVEKAEILAIIGPNGAGKTSLLNCISGFYHPQRGNIFLRGRNINKLSPHKRAALGLSRTFQNMQLYAGLSTLDNLMAARHVHLKPRVIPSALFFGSARRKEIEHREIVEHVIDFMDLESMRHKVVGALAYGQRKQVDLARALALEPKILLLDEPMAGLNVEEKEDMARFIIDIYELNNIPIILVEHDMGVVMDISDHVVVLDFGVKIADGSPSEIKANPDVIRVYLGE